MDDAVVPFRNTLVLAPYWFLANAAGTGCAGDTQVEWPHKLQFQGGTQEEGTYHINSLNRPLAQCL